MNTKKIEEIAVAAIRKEIHRNDYLSDEIPTNDKTPSWDGEIWIFKTKEQRKSDLYGKVPVQVKGKKVDEFSKETTKFVLNKADLNNYYTHGGVLYLVVEIIDSDTTQIFYESLLPVDIKKILEEMKQQQTITKLFKRLPAINRAFEFINKNFIFNSRKQGLSLLTEFNVDGLGGFDEYRTTVLLPNRDNPKGYLFDSDFYLYGRLDKFNLDIPLHKIQLITITEKANLTVGINEEIYYTEVSRVTERNRKTLQFGKSFTVVLRQDFQSNTQSPSPSGHNATQFNSIKFHFKESGSIRDRIKDCSFMLKVIKNKKIEINGVEIKLNQFITDEDTLIEKLPEYINYLKEISETFNQLGVTFNLDLNDLSKNDKMHAELLRDTILYKDYTRLNLNKNKHFLRFEIADINIVLVSTKTSEGWLVFDLFDIDDLSNNFKIMATSKDEKVQVKHSPFLLFEPQHLFGLGNLKLRAIESSFKQLDYEQDMSFVLTNDFLLKSLSFFDQQRNRKDILEMILNIYKYINALRPNDILTFMNKMQTIKRTRSFTNEEKSHIVHSKNKYQHSDEILCGFHILLDNKIEFEVQFNKLSLEEKETFKSYPIYHLIQ